MNGLEWIIGHSTANVAWRLIIPAWSILMKAEDILPDRQDRIRLDGVEIRKGSVGAFIANARLLLERDRPAAQRRQAEEDLRALLPAIRALGLLELFELRDARLRALVADWENAAGGS